MKFLSRLLIFSVFFWIFYSPSASFSSDLSDLKTDVALIKSNLENANAKLAEAMNQLTTIQQEFNAMKGVTEGGSYFQQEQSRSLREYDQRITAMEDKITTLMTLLKDIKEGGGVGSAPKVGAADENQVREFQRLLDYINSEDYAKALPGFQGFLQKYPKSPMADNAQYWIAESYYGLNDYKKAIAEYQGLIQRYPRSPKVKLALLKQGLSFYGLKMYADAKPFFEKVANEYPNTSEATKAQGKIKEIDRLLANPNPPAPTPSPGPAPSTSTPPSSPTSNSPGVNTYPKPKPTPSGGLYD